MREAIGLQCLYPLSFSRKTLSPDRSYALSNPLTTLDPMKIDKENQKNHLRSHYASLNHQDVAANNLLNNKKTLKSTKF